MNNIEKVIQLIEEKEIELNLYIIEYRFDDKGDVHFLTKRESRGDYAVWTAYNSDTRAYENFYNGFYADNVMEAVGEFCCRIRKGTKLEFKFYFYAGFDKPKLLASSLDEFKKDVSINSNYLGDLTNDVMKDIEFLESNATSLDELADDLKELLVTYNIFVNPLVKELQEFNESKCLNKDEYLSEFMELVG